MDGKLEARTHSAFDKLPPCFPRPPLGSLPLTLLELTFSKDILSTSDIN
jgi:hypothetical protein